MAAYYNEFDPYAAQWLRNLIAAGHIAPGDVDERSLLEVQPDDLKGYTQCHFFAGIGVWAYALRQARWADDRPIWTGSCPCQPFSAAGKQEGFEDERHLWPVWFNLIEQCRPPVVLGEQVASALGWLDLVSADMEGAGYAIGASDLCAAGFGGAHIRQRLYFVGLADGDDARSQGHWQPRNVDAPQGREAAGRHSAESGVDGGLADDELDGRGQSGAFTGRRGEGSSAQGLGERTAVGSDECRAGAPMLGRDAADWLFCRDGRWRPVEPGTQPLAHEITSRVGRLRAYGNALDAETATQFCAAVKDICDDLAFLQSTLAS
jgi:DNA (cytosine-5)-methyltransferase 1